MFDINYYNSRRQELQARYSQKLNKLGQAALDYAGDVAELQKQLDEINQREAQTGTAQGIVKAEQEIVEKEKK